MQSRGLEPVHAVFCSTFLMNGKVGIVSNKLSQLLLIGQDGGGPFNRNGRLDSRSAFLIVCSESSPC